MEKNNELTPFEGKGIRKVWHDEQWYFSVVDVIQVLTDSKNPNRYWTDLKRRTEKESGQSYAYCVSMKLSGTDGRKRLTDCANTEGIFRIIMSVPSPKAEPLRLWLAQVGAERIEETENPELAFDRAREIYKAKGYPDDWIGYREKSILIRKELTDEWQKRGIKESIEYKILTAEIAKATFGVTPSEHGELKGLKKQNLRDHMTNLELIFSALGEEIARTESIKVNAQGFGENRESAIKGGMIASEALERVELRTGEKVVSTKNYLHLGNGDKPNEIPEGDPPVI
jgi:prophage antirepressor-like protein